MDTLTIHDVTVEPWQHGSDVGSKRDALCAFYTHLASKGREDMPDDMYALAPCGKGAMRQTYKDSRYRFVYKLAVHGSTIEGMRTRNELNESEYRMMHALAGHKATRPYVSPTALYWIDGVAVIAMLARTTGNGHSVNNEAKARMLRALYAFTHATGERVRDLHYENIRATPSCRPRMIDVGAVLWGMSDSDIDDENSDYGDPEDSPTPEYGDFDEPSACGAWDPKNVWACDRPPSHTGQHRNHIIPKVWARKSGHATNDLRCHPAAWGTCPQHATIASIPNDPPQGALFAIAWNERTTMDHE